MTRSRVLAVAAAAAGMAISAFAGATAAHSQPWLLVPAVTALAYLVGLLAALGPDAAVVSLQWAVALLVGSALPLSPGPAGVRAGLVLAGGLWQGALVVLSWGLSQGSTERRALAETYAGLSQYATALADGSPGPPTAAALPGTKVLTDPNPLLRDAARLQLRDLLEEAERIRATLTALGAPGPDDQALTDLLATAALVLGDIDVVLSSRAGTPGARAAWRAGALRRAHQRLENAQPVPDTRWRWAGQALYGQLRGAITIAAQLNEAEPDRGRSGWRSGGTDLGLDRQRAWPMSCARRSTPRSNAWSVGVREQGREPSEDIEVAIIRPPARIAARLQLGDGEAAVVRRRGRRVDGEIILLADSY